ncbi:MAG: tryptophan synthase subunit beta [Gammaproteobacteria bacterium]
MAELAQLDRNGWGGTYVPETLIAPLAHLTEAWQLAWGDEQFQQELHTALKDFVGRPTSLCQSAYTPKGSARILLKREDLCHTGAHKINNTMGQALLARRMGKTALIAETGAGQHGVATASVAARLGMTCRVYMGETDMERQQLNVFRMRLLGAEVRAVATGTARLKDAMSEAMRDWVSSFQDSHYVIGSAAGPAPYPEMVAKFQSVLGEEARSQCLDQFGRLPDVLVACVGGGSNAIGLFRPFLQDQKVQMYGVEAGGRSIDEVGAHAATLNRGRPGILHGFRSYLLQDDQGQVQDTHSISAGLDYPGVGPEHAWLQDTGRVQYVSVSDQQALQACEQLNRMDGILPALESAHALAWAYKLQQELSENQLILVNLSGRGDKDVPALMQNDLLSKRFSE